MSVVKDLLGSFSTNYRSSGWGRAKNVENGASKINGTILYPGDELSVYELVNPFTQENGYELAGSYLNGETVESFGGGICQVSTTLYNAALKAELEITQRYNHSMIVTYVDLSADAAIAGTYKDYVLKISMISQSILKELAVIETLHSISMVLKLVLQTEKFLMKVLPYR